MPEAAIALGSNLGDRTANLVMATKELGRLGKVAAVSSFYDTAPVGFVQQPRFLNAAAVLKTSFPPAELLQALLGIEQQMGRVRGSNEPAKGPRLIDLDLLLYDQTIVQTEALTLPHPEMHGRRFVLEPLAEIAPAWMHPRLGVSIFDLYAKLAAPSSRLPTGLGSPG